MTDIPMVPLDPTETLAYINAHPWTFAKSMPFIPHWWTLRRQARADHEFSRFVMAVQTRGVPRQFGKRTFIYLDVGDWTYWTMGAPVEETILVNRAAIVAPSKSKEPASVRRPESPQPRLFPDS